MCLSAHADTDTQCRAMSAVIGKYGSPNTQGNPVWAIAYGQVVKVGLIKTDGDVETIGGDNRWLWLADGSGFTWARNFKKES
jgi:hypothetical protein